MKENTFPWWTIIVGFLVWVVTFCIGIYVFDLLGLKITDKNYKDLLFCEGFLYGVFLIEFIIVLSIRTHALLEDGCKLRSSFFYLIIIVFIDAIASIIIIILAFSKERGPSEWICLMFSMIVSLKALKDIFTYCDSIFFEGETRKELKSTLEM